MKTFTEQLPAFLSAMRRGRVRYDWRRHRYIGTCEGCGKVVVVEDQYGNDVRSEVELDEIASGHDTVRGDKLYYPQHVSTPPRAVRCEMSLQPLGSLPRD